MKLSIGAAVVVACLAGAAQAAEVGGVRLDDGASVGGQALVLNGAGVRTRLLFFNAYVASLYLPAKARSLPAALSKGPRRIQLNLLRKFAADDLVDLLVAGLKDNASAEEFASMKPQIDQLAVMVRSIGAMKEGDVVTLDFHGGATRIAHNGEPKGAIAGDSFNHALTRIWIGERPAQGDLKKAMLGG